MSVWRRRAFQGLVIGIAVLALAWAAYRLRELTLMAGLGALLAFVLDPLVERLATRMGRAYAVALVFTALVALLAVGVGAGVPTLVHQGQALVAETPELQALWEGNAVAPSRPARSGHPDLREITSRLHTLTESVDGWYDSTPQPLHQAIDVSLVQVRLLMRSLFRPMAGLLVGLVAWVARSVVILMFALYLLLDKQLMLRAVHRAIPPGYRQDALLVVDDVTHVLGSYLRGQGVVILSGTVAFTLLFLLLGVPHALMLGIFAGVLQIVPYFGAIAGGLPAVALGLAQSGVVGVAASVGVLVINQIEGHLVIPLVMGHSVGLRPLTVLAALIGGAELGGIAGMIIAIPLVGVTKVFLIHSWRLYQDMQQRDAARLEAARSTPPDAPLLRTVAGGSASGILPD